MVVRGGGAASYERGTPVALGFEFSVMCSELRVEGAGFKMSNYSAPPLCSRPGTKRARNRHHPGALPVRFGPKNAIWSTDVERPPLRHRRHDAAATNNRADEIE